MKIGTKVIIIKNNGTYGFVGKTGTIVGSYNEQETYFAIRFPKKQTGTHCCDDLTPKGNGRYFEKDFFKIYNKFETLLKKYENKRFE